MEPFDVPVMALRVDDEMKVGMERYEKVTSIDHREPGSVKVLVKSGIVYEFGYDDTVTVSSHEPRRRHGTHQLGCLR